MSPSPEESLGRAWAAESRLAARLEAMAAKAGQEGRADLARLFTALVASQQARARRYLMLLRGKIADSQANLEGLARREWPGLLAQLAAAWADQDQQPSANALEQAQQVGAQAQDLLRQAQEPGGLARAWAVCQVCGYLAAGQPPQRCPVCGAVAQRFSLVQ